MRGIAVRPCSVQASFPALRFASAYLLNANESTQELARAGRRDLLHTETTPSDEAFTLPPPGAQGPEITPYLRYQTSLAWRQNEAWCNTLIEFLSPIPCSLLPELIPLFQFASVHR